MSKQNNQGKKFYGHEAANLNAMANTLGPDLANKLYQNPPGEPTFYEEFGSDINAGRYAQEQVQEYNNTQNGGISMQQNNQGYGQAQGQAQQPYGQQQAQQYGGQPQGTQNYQQQYVPGQTGQPSTQGVNSPREWKMEAGGHATSEYYDRLPKVNGQAIVAVRKNGRGNIQAFQLQGGQEMDYAQMLNAAIGNQVSGLRVQANQEGELIIRSVPDGFTDNNLDNLPNF